MSGQFRYREVLCTASRCSIAVKPGMLMCREHWLSLPMPLRIAILRTWRAGQTTAYQKYVRQAVDMIDAAELGARQDVFA